jgi:hypothetical protein
MAILTECSAGFDQPHWVEDLHHLHMHQRYLLPDNLLLLPWVYVELGRGNLTDLGAAETSNISLEDIDKIFLPAEMQDYASRHNSVAQMEGPEGSNSSKGDVTNQIEKGE